MTNGESGNEWNGLTWLLWVKPIELREELVAPCIIVLGLVHLDDADDEGVVHKLELVEEGAVCGDLPGDLGVLERGEVEVKADGLALSKKEDGGWVGG